MKFNWFATFCLCGLLLASTTHAQNAIEQDRSYPQDYFTAPVDIPMFLAGNFAEIRPNHFHGGIDIKTQGVEGKNILAAADGYVSRIKISTFGYGKVLYVNHPNGYTTAYAHLSSFNDAIGAYIEKAQYYREKFEIELFPGPGELVVKQGEVIALGGNSGGSGGPHLHFEIRDTKTEVPINPLLFGFSIKDDIKPIIKNIGIYPANDSSYAMSLPKPKIMKATGAAGNYKLLSKSAIPVYGDLGFAIEVIDKTNGSSNRCGVYSIELLVDSERVFYHDVERVGFHESRYINCHVDYKDKKQNGRRMQRSFLLPNNKLATYEDVKNRGILSFRDDAEHLIEYRVKDAYGNASTLAFNVKADANMVRKPAQSNTKADTVVAFHCNADNHFVNEDCKVFLPRNLLYEDSPFEYRQTPGTGKMQADVHYLHHSYTPLHSYMDLSIRPDKLPETAKPKTVIVALDNNLNVVASEGGEWNGDFLRTRTRTFGPYSVMVDSIPPRIVSLNLVNGQSMTGVGTISMKISDNLSGIESYKGYIDEKWCLMDYDYKTKKLVYQFDDARVAPGEHTFRLEVADERGNTSEFKARFTR